MAGVWSKLNQQIARIFTHAPRHASKWKKAYGLRSAVERVFFRVVGGYPIDHHNIRGIVRMKATMGLSMVLMVQLAIVRIRVWGAPDAFIG